MKGRKAPIKMYLEEMPQPLPKVVEAVLEVDRLFWLDPKNKMVRQFSRKLVKEETLPYVLPETAAVLVSPWGRTFISLGKPVLMIVDNKTRGSHMSKPKKARDHRIGQAMADFRSFITSHIPKPTPTSAVLSSEQRQVMAESERQRQSERRAIRQQERQATRMRKRGGDDTAAQDPVA